jgi:hypothetical protein
MKPGAFAALIQNGQDVGQILAVVEERHSENGVSRSSFGSATSHLKSSHSNYLPFGSQAGTVCDFAIFLRSHPIALGPPALPLLDHFSA